MAANPFLDFNSAIFTKYISSEPKEVKLKDPFDNITDISDWASNILPNGNILTSPNTPEAARTFDTSFMNDMAQTHSEPSLDITYNTKLNLQGNKKRAMEFFLSKGLSAHLAAGIVGNLLGESNLNYLAVNPTSKAFGIALWLGDRKKKLFKRYGEKPTFDLQLEFVWEELNSSEKSAFDKLLLTKSVEEATNSFMKHFERPSLREMALSINNRIKFSRDLLA